jgi:hypothetical protein
MKSRRSTQPRPRTRRHLAETHVHARPPPLVRYHRRHLAETHVHARPPPLVRNHR